MKHAFVMSSKCCNAGFTRLGTAEDIGYGATCDKCGKMCGIKLFTAKRINNNLQKLAELGIEDIWWTNFIEDCVINEKNIDERFEHLLQCRSFLYFIGTSFKWDMTAQDHEFWHEMSLK